MAQRPAYATRARWPPLRDPNQNRYYKQSTTHSVIKSTIFVYFCIAPVTNVIHLASPGSLEVILRCTIREKVWDQPGRDNLS